MFKNNFKNEKKPDNMQLSDFKKFDCINNQ